MKPPTSDIVRNSYQHGDYIQPPENISLKSPLELLANACNKLETSMMSQSNGSHKPTSTASLLQPQKVPSPPHSAVTANNHLPLRLAPTRTTAEPISLTKNGSYKLEGQTPYSMSSELLRQKLSPNTDFEQRQSSPEQKVTPPPSSEPISLVSKQTIAPNPSPSPQSEMPQNLTKPKSPERQQVASTQPEETETQTKPVTMASLKVKPTEALSPAGQLPHNIQTASFAKRATPSPRSSNGRPFSSSPANIPATSSMSPSPQQQMAMINSLAHGLMPPSTSTMAAPSPQHQMAMINSLAQSGTVYPGIPGFPPGYPSYLGLGGPQPPTPGAPCTDPLCRDPSCPTFAMRAAQAQLLGQLGAAAGMGGMPLGYPYSLPPGLAGLGGSIPGLPYGVPVSLAGGAPAGLPGMLPPSLLGLPQATVPSYSPQSQTPPTPTSTSNGPSLSGVGTSPYMCSWMQGPQGRDGFCGRRFNSSEELMSHLRSHTANMGTEPSPPSASLPAVIPPPASALAMLQAQAAQLRSQVSPPSSSSSSSSEPSRYHPYARPGGPSLPSGFPGSPALPPNPMLASLYGSPRHIMPVLP